MHAAKARIKFIMPISLVLLAVSVLLGCQREQANDATRVERIFLSDSTLVIGEASTLALDFSFDRKAVFSEQQNVVVVIAIPSGMIFRHNSAAIDGFIFDKEVGAQRTNCENANYNYLVFDLDVFDLEAAMDPQGPANSRISLKLEAIKEGSYLISARADKIHAFFDCNLEFLSQEQIPVRVFPKR